MLSEAIAGDGMIDGSYPIEAMTPRERFEYDRRRFRLSDRLDEVRRTEEEWQFRHMLAGTDYYADFRDRVATQLVIDVAALGFPHPRVLIGRMMDELHYVNDIKAEIFSAYLESMFLYQAAIDVKERRGGDKFDWRHDDLAEAEHELGFRRTEIRERIAFLERRLAQALLPDADSKARVDTLERRLKKAMAERDRASKVVDEIQRRLEAALEVPA